MHQRQRQRRSETKETKETKGDKGDGEGREASHFDGEGRRTSCFDAYLYLIQAIYMEVEAEKALGETQRNTMEPAT